MRLASFRFEGRERIGFAIDDGHVVDLAEAAAAAGHDAAAVPRDMVALIEAGADGRRFLDDAADLAAARPDRVRTIPLDAIEWRPPVRRPAKICGLAMNNSASDARKISAPEHPLFFLKPSSCLIGNGQAIEVYEDYGSVHPEPELAVVIGTECRHVAAAEAMEVVYGYSIMNDMTGNAMRAEDMVYYKALYPKRERPDEVEEREQHLSYTARYKGSDTFGPFGPWLVTKDAVPDPHALDVLCWHKDELIAEDSTAFYTYSVPETIAFITRFHSLWPGDVISMGTAFRPGKGGKRSLHTADVTARGGPVSVAITGLGTLTNPVRVLKRPR